MNYKKLIIAVLGLFIINIQLVMASDNKIPYKKIQNGDKIKLLENGFYSINKVSKTNTDIIFTKVNNEVDGSAGFYTSDGNSIIYIDTDYEFLYNKSLIGYSNSQLKFYELKYEDNSLSYTEMTRDEIQQMFPDYTVVTITDFSGIMNSLKIKKNRGTLKLILINDTDIDFTDYAFSSSIAKFNTGLLKGFINIRKSGLIQFSSFRNSTQNNELPWYVLLIK